VIAEHEDYFESCHDLEARRHGKALIKLVKDILKDCRSCPHRLNTEVAESGLTLFQTMQKRLIEEALKQWPEPRTCAYKMGIAIRNFSGYINRYNINIPD